MKKTIATLSAAAVLSSGFASSALAANTYTVKSGDNLSKIAAAHKTTVSQLKKLNHLTSDLIYANQKLKVSGTASTTTAKASAAKSTANISKTTTVTYTVKAGDNLTKIANKHSVTLAELQSLNHLKSTVIYPGDVLIISKSTTTTVVDLPGKSAPKASPSSISSGSTYTIQAGDTLSKIAAKFSLTVKELKSLNGLTSDVIYAGKTLIVSKSASPSKSEAKPASDTSAQPSSQQKVQTLISEAKKLIGTPYSWAGSSPSGFDCSGFVYYVMKKAGYSISRTSASTYFDLGKSVKAPQAGDLIFFAGNPAVKSIITHMGIYLGNGEFIHASTSSGVTISSTSSSYYKERLAGYKAF